MSEQLCVICGIRPATTRDHVPPKSIFAKPLPSDVITVPACKECNISISDHAERFRAYLSLHVGMESAPAKQLWEQHALETLRHNRKLRNKILTQAQSVYLTTEAGVIYGEGEKLLWDSPAHDVVVERLVRGLYYHHFNGILGDRVVVRVQWLRELTEDIYRMAQAWQGNSIGNNLFIYRYAKASDQPLTSVWIFQFYDRHWAGGYTLPAAQTKPNEDKSLCKSRLVPDTKS